MPPKIGERIRQARKEAGFTLKKMGEATGVSPQGFAKWEKGENRTPAAALAQIALMTGKPIGWFHGNDLLHAVQINPTSVALLSEVGRIVPRVEFKKVTAHLKNKGSAEVLGLVHTQYPCGPRSFSLRVGDDSNAPMLTEGDSIVIDPDLKPRPGDMVLVATGDSDSPVLRRYRQREGSVELAPLNADWPPTTVETLDKSNLLGVMTESTKPARAR